MSIIEKIEQKSRINTNEVVERLRRDFNIGDKEEINTILYDALYGTLQLILNTTNRDYIIEDMYSIWVDMTVDYWSLNGFDKKVSKLSVDTEQEAESNNTNLKIKSIKRGDTETSFSENNNETTINGTVYKTGTINYDEDILLEKYIKRLYKFRLLGRKRRW